MARGRKVNSNGERSRKLLREKAIEIFSENGYFQTKISDIVKAANVTQPTFYLYFDSKEALYNDIIVDFHKSLESIIDDTVEEYQSKHDSTQTLKVTLARVFNYFAKNPHLTKIGLKESNAPFITEVLPEKVQYILEKNLKSLQKTDVSLHIFTQSLLGSVKRLTLALLLPKNKQPELLAEELVKLYFSNDKSKVTV